MAAVAIAGALAAPAAAVAATDPDPTIQQIYYTARTGHIARAQAMIEQVLRDHPHSAKAHYVAAELYAKQANWPQARRELAQAEQIDPALSFAEPQASDALKGAIRAAGIASPPAVLPSPEAAATPPSTSRIRLATTGGTMMAPVMINHAIRLNFTVDSGASNVSIPADVFATLVRAGTITQADIKGTETFLNANGEKHQMRTFIIRTLTVGNVEVHDVESIVAPANAPLLLGQTFLRRFKNWSIDNSSRELILER